MHAYSLQISARLFVLDKICVVVYHLLMSAKENRGGFRSGAGRKPAGFVDEYKLTNGLKKCKACAALLPAGSFGKNASAKDGLYYMCLGCCRSSYVSVKKPREVKPKVVPNEKECGVCGFVKPISDFGVANHTKDGFNIYCKPCVKDRSYRTRRALGMSVFAPVSETTKACNRLIESRQQNKTDVCELSLAEFYRKWAFCLDELGRVLPEHVGTYTGFLQAVGRGTASEYRVKKVSQERTNPIDRGVSVEKILFGRVRHRVRKFAKRYNVNYDERFATLQGRSIDEFFNERFGYGVSQLADHLERQFTEGMDWRRFAAGEIHIDHKSPMIMFGVENPTHLRNCFALSNLQPLWAADNSAKNSMCDLTGHRFRRCV